MSISTLAPIQTEEEKSQELKRKFFPKGISLLANGINAFYKVSPRWCSRATMFLLSISIRKKLKATDLEFYKKGKKQTYQYGKHTFHTYSYGSGPKILFAHGWASNGARWKNYVDKIVARGYTAVVVDAPGQGTSKGYFLSVPDYIKCMKVVFQSSKKWHGIIAHSVGSLVSIIGASEAGVNLKKSKVVMMCTFADCDALMTKYAKCMGIKDEVLNYTKKNIDKIYDQPLSYFSLTCHYKKLSPDGFLLSNFNDIVVPLREMKKIQTALPQLKGFQTHQGGHNLRSQEVEERVLAFI